MAKYRMTPKRRAALRKAQLASARKRRKSRNRNLLIGAGVGASAVLGTGIAAYAGRNYISRVARGGPKRRNLFDELPPAQLALPPGRSVTKVKRTKRPTPKRSGVFKVDSSGEFHYVKRNRAAYDARRRAGLVKGYERKVRSKYDGLSPRTQRRRNAKRG